MSGSIVANSKALSKYANKVKESESKFSFQRSIYDNWNLSFIFFLINNVSKVDLIVFLIEQKFLIPNHLTCKNCNLQKKLELVQRSSSTDHCVWKCHTKISKLQCPGMVSVRKNSWFSQSKLSIFEILILTYAWWTGIIRKVNKTFLFILTNVFIS